MSPSCRNSWSVLITSPIGNLWNLDPGRQITFRGKRAMLHRLSSWAVALLVIRSEESNP